MSRIGVFGGTFNPIHNGHLHLAGELIDRLNLDRLLLIPDWSPPHKDADELIDAGLRLEMCRLACEGREHIEVSDIELKRGGRSYTADTLQELKAIYPVDELCLITGSDMFLTLHQWKNFELISRLALLCTAPRHKGEVPKLEEYARWLQKTYGSNTAVADILVRDISSTEIREALAGGGSVIEREMLPEKVYDFIMKNGLYHCGAGGKNETDRISKT